MSQKLSTPELDFPVYDWLLVVIIDVWLVICVSSWVTRCRCECIIQSGEKHRKNKSRDREGRGSTSHVLITLRRGLHVPGHNQLNKTRVLEIGKKLITHHILSFLWSKLLNKVIRSRTSHRDLNYLVLVWQSENLGRKWSREPCCCCCLITKSSLRLVRNRTKLMKIFQTEENKWKYFVASWLDSI